MQAARHYREQVISALAIAVLFPINYPIIVPRKVRGSRLDLLFPVNYPIELLEHCFPLLLLLINLVHGSVLVVGDRACSCHFL